MLVETPTSPTNTEANIPSVLKRKHIIFTNQVKLQIASSAIYGFLVITTIVIIPIFLGTPSYISTSTSLGNVKMNILFPNGGFGLTTTQTANVLLCQAFFSIFAQMVIIPRAIAHFGPVWSRRYASMGLAVFYIVLPFLVELPDILSVVAVACLLGFYSLTVGIWSTSQNILYVCFSPAPLSLFRA